MCLAVPGKVVEIMDAGDLAFRRAKVDFGGIRKEISLAYTPEAEIGKYVLVHVGFAISVIDEDEAQIGRNRRGMVERLACAHVERHSRDDVQPRTHAGDPPPSTPRRYANFVGRWCSESSCGNYHG